MRILITGGLGHIGSCILHELPKIMTELEIVIVDNLSNQRYCSLFNLPKNCKYKFYNKSIQNFDFNILGNLDLVIHLAAITDATSSFKKATLVKSNNFDTTEIMADYCSNKGIKLIYPSTTSVYGTQNTKVDEFCSVEDLKPQSPYAETKIEEEEYIQEKCENSGLKAIICRLATIYGVSPGIRFHTAVNKFCMQAALGEPITVWETAYEQLRPYLSLSDATKAISFLNEKADFNGEIYNVVTENHTVKEVVDIIREFKPNLEVNFVQHQIMNQLSFEVEPKRLNKLNFEFKGDLRSSIKNTIELLEQANSIESIK